MIIPISSLPPATLDNILKEHILREGTDYGEQEVSIDTQMEQLKQQLMREEIVLVYSEIHESVNLLPKAQFVQTSD
ncbi:YheU family protein [Psychrobium sp. MM17-31]|uniref:YheU family protein n=1 Tax=Psychrobium sp. MM17-31 TaxID=2917758 RepID=UPI001EF6AF2D|nr:YheU family protein [Psychrobium sp. MM17-31]MCG7532568.1 YheU family protein [Psychrobium sp. MM17-31]